MRSVYMIRRGAHWVKDPALATAGFPWLSFKVKRDAEMWLLANGLRQGDDTEQCTFAMHHRDFTRMAGFCRYLRKTLNEA